MESLNRKLMLLKPGIGFQMAGKNGAALKVWQSGRGVELSLIADCLGEGDYFLYLFTAAKELYAGDVRAGALHTFVPDVQLESIKGAAVVRREGASYSFCLKSSGCDWAEAVRRFTAVRLAAKRDDVRKTAVPPEVMADAEEEPVSNTPKTEPMYFGIPETLYKQTAPPEPDIAPEVMEELKRQEDLNEKTEPGCEESGCDDCAGALRQEKISPFPAIFPNSEWVRISYPGPAGWWHYISGRIYKGGALVAKALGVPGEYGITPPIWLEGFGTYLRCFTGDARGYWLMFQDAETGEVLDMGLSPHGA